MNDHTIQEAMTSNPTTIESSTTSQDAARTMSSENIGSLPIVDGDRLVGVIADRDLAIRVLGHDALTGETVQQISK